MSNDLSRSETWTVHTCRGCGTILGEVRAVIRLKTCPECERPCVPVEDETDRITVMEVPPKRSYLESVGEEGQQ